MGTGTDKTRAHRRRTVDWRVTCRCRDWHAAARIANVSRAGLFVRAEQPPAVGSTVELTVELPDGLRLDLRGTVRHVISPETARATGRLPGAGIEIDPASATDLTLLERMADAERSSPDGAVVGRVALATVASVARSDGGPRGATILVVEDDEDLRELLTLALADHGFRVAVAHDGCEGLAYLAAHPPPRAILLDLRMPCVDGARFLQAMGSAGIAGARVVIMTAEKDPDVDRLIALGASRVVGKPFEIARLLELLGEET